MLNSDYIGQERLAFGLDVKLNKLSPIFILNPATWCVHDFGGGPFGSRRREW